MNDRKRGHVSFGAFEMDLGTGELRKYGTRILLQKQPFEVLALLLEKPGELVTREELKARTWGSDTYIDFDQGVNKAIKKVRAALGDSAEQPRYIETLAKRGYRFIASVSLDCESPATINPNLLFKPLGMSPSPMSKPAEAAALETLPVVGPQKRKRWLRLPVFGGGVSAVLGLLLLTFFIIRRQPHPRPDLKPKQLTTNADENFIASAILSPDGKYLLYGDQMGIHLRLIATGETHTFTKPTNLSAGDSWFPTAWFPDQAHFIAVSEALTPEGLITKSWIVTVVGDAVGELRADAFAHSVSPDGALIAYTAGLWTSREIWVSGPRGEDARRIAANDDSVSFFDVQWSPDGRRLSDVKYQAGGSAYGQYILESRDMKGGPATSIVSLAQQFPCWKNGGGFSWLPDERIIYTAAELSPDVSDTNLWEIAVDPESGRPRGPAHRLANWFGFHISSLSAARDGKRMALQKSSSQFDVYVGEFDRSGLLQTPRRLTLEQSNDLPWAWTPDSKSVIFLSDRNGSPRLYKQRLDQDTADPITTGPDVNFIARVSPDGRWIIYNAFPKGGPLGPGRLMRVPVSGGPSEIVMSVARSGDISCPLSPATRCLSLQFKDKQEIFTSFDPVRGDGYELFRNSIESGRLFGGGWGISPDASQIAVFKRSPGAAWIQFVSLAGKLKQEALIKGCSTPGSLDWSADGKWMYTACYSPRGSTILRVDRTGQTQPLSHMGGVSLDWAIPSPDGRYLAIMGDTTNSNVWLLENF